MKTTNDGGPFHPIKAHRTSVVVTMPDGSKQFQDADVSSLGISLRDWFAGQALAGLMPRVVFGFHGNWTAKDAAMHAYLVADAMLAAREE